MVYFNGACGDVGGCIGGDDEFSLVLLNSSRHGDRRKEQDSRPN